MNYLEDIAVKATIGVNLFMQANLNLLSNLQLLEG